MIKRKQRAKRGRRKGRRVPPAHGVSLKVILAHLARYFRREGVDTCLGEVENHGESSQGDLVWEEEEEGEGRGEAYTSRIILRAKRDPNRAEREEARKKKRQGRTPIKRGTK